jgi:hypothetical protein
MDGCVNMARGAVRITMKLFDDWCRHHEVPVGSSLESQFALRDHHQYAHDFADHPQDLVCFDLSEVNLAYAISRWMPPSPVRRRNAIYNAIYMLYGVDNVIDMASLLVEPSSKPVNS